MKLKDARIFLSYNPKDEKEVMKLYRQLKDAGYHPCIDSEDISGGEDWEEFTKREIEAAALFMPCLTRNSITPGGIVQKEIHFALTVWELKSEDDIYLIPVRLEDCAMPGRLRKFYSINLFKENGFQRLINSIDAALERLELIPQLRFRAESIENLCEDEVKEMLRVNDFYHRAWHEGGKGVRHEYELKTLKDHTVIIDHTTGLMWQRGGSEEEIEYEKIKGYIKDLNSEKFAGFNDWRLPTLEEAMTLVEPKKIDDTGLYIADIFDKTQEWVWTSDLLYSASRAWFAGFYYGSCGSLVSGLFSYVRAVRSTYSTEC